MFMATNDSTMTLNFPSCSISGRKIVYSTNRIENVNRGIPLLAALQTLEGVPVDIRSLRVFFI
jgi:hypothetical protein